MFCTKCGAQIPNDAIFCPTCGAETHGESLNNTNTAYNEQRTIVTDAENEELASDALKFGILGAVFSNTGILAILGIIFSAIAQSKAGEYHRRTGSYGVKAGIGRGLGIGGLALGIFMTAFLALYFIIIVALIGAGW